MRRQTYKDVSGTVRDQLLAKEDMTELYDLLADEILKYRGDFTGDGIVSGLTPSDAGSGVLEVTAGVFYRNSERVETSSTESIDLSGESDGTYYVYVVETESIQQRAVPQDRVITADGTGDYDGDKVHRSLDYTATFSYSTDDDEDKIKVCSVDIVSNEIDSVDTSFRDSISLTGVLNDTAQNYTTGWTSQKIVDYILTQLANVKDPVINTLSSPPGSPSDDDRYIVDSGASGDWSGHDNEIAQWNTETDPDNWSFTSPDDGMMVYHQILGYYVLWDGASWVRFEETISFDNIPDGTTYGKVKNSQTGNITNSSGDLSTNVDDSTIQNNGSNQLEVIESGINLSNVSGDLDDIDDGEDYGKVKKSQSNEIDFSGGDLSFTNDAKTDIANPYLTEYVLPEGQMSDHAKDNTIVQGNQGSPVFGSKIYRVDTSVVETGVRWQSDLIPVRTDETLEFIISDTSHNNGSGEDIRIVLAERDKDYNYYNSKSETVSATDNSIRVSFTTSSSTVRYVYFRIYASETSAWGASGFWKFTNPIIRRKSKHGTEYTFRAKWTGDLEDDATPDYDILENTDNKLSSISANSSTNLEINFESGFLHEDDIITLHLGKIISNMKKTGIINDSSSSEEEIFNITYENDYSNNSINIIWLRQPDGGLISLCNEIGSNENFVEVIVRKRG